MLNKQQIKSSSIPILKKNGVTKAALFGSFVRGDNTETSDIDFLVEFENGKSLFDLVGLQFELKELFHRNVDVLTYNSVHPRLRESIFNEQEVFYEMLPAMIL